MVFAGTVYWRCTQVVSQPFQPFTVSTPAEAGGQLEVGGAALLVEADVEHPVTGHALPGRSPELEAEPDVERVLDPDDPPRRHAAGVEDLGVPVRVQQRGLGINLCVSIQVIAWPADRGWSLRLAGEGVHGADGVVMIALLNGFTGFSARWPRA